MDLTLRLHDSLTRRDIAVEPRTNGPLRVYACGPTIYNFQHIGNFRKFMMDDLLVRTLHLLNYNVQFVMNITDVGHMTGDSDEGEDKIEAASHKEAVDVESLIVRYLAAFEADWTAHRFVMPDARPRASHFIDDQIALAQILVERGHAYDTPEALYFDVTSSPNYGLLTGQRLEDKAVGVREEVVTETNKRHPADFALWLKRVGRYEHHIQHWDSPWGDGFPGWHLECSALAHHFLDHPIDIHTGGIDNKFPHHTNEIAQSEGAYGAPFSQIWIHAEHILVDNEKMSKSVGNVVLPRDLIDRGYALEDFRYLVLSTHYRTRLNFTWEGLSAAKAGRRTLLETYWAAGEATGPADDDLLDRFRSALADDLGSPRALALAHEATKLAPGPRRRTLEEMDAVLHILVPVPVPSQEVLDLLARYQETRSNKQFVQSDAIRAEIQALGWMVQDSPAGPHLSPLS